jgi:septum formation inhibitor-activating ATPase MinD
MIVFATSDKGGTGRSVTSSNIVYRRALQGNDTCYVDFDFG